MSRVLVVDDESIIGVILRLALDAKGHETLVAPDGRSGIEIAKAEHPDAIVLDLMMPGVNGYDVLDAVRHSSDLDEVPVVRRCAGDRVLRPDRRECGKKFRDPERRQRGSAAQGDDFGHSEL